MSGTFADRITQWGAIAVTVIVLLIFEGAIVVAWLTHDASLGILLGIAGSNASTAVAYWIGSSTGSAKKTAIMADQALSMTLPPPAKPTP